MKAQAQTRRKFCVGTCSTAALASLGTALASCGGGSGSPTSPGGGSTFSSLPQVNGASATGSITVNVAGTALARVGGLALVRSSAGDVLVARTGDAAFTALTSICTHENCAITAFSGSAFVCTCHGSQFDAAGKVLVGPARTALRQYSTTFAGDILTITA
jgi:nitrite reductase/ring-hydroxylating ferredoxin subunit